jgi:thiol-disulfide isomerase/thioredoxin
MAIIPELYCLARINPESARELAVSVCGSSGISSSRSRTNLLSFKTSSIVCHSSLNSTTYTARREIQAGADSIAEWGQKGQRGHAWRNTCKPARGIKINRDPVKVEEDEDDDPELCSVDCVREFKSRIEFDEILQYAKEEKALVVVDFFKTACGSCRYIEKGFAKLCKGAGNTDVTVIFLKHNVS